MQQEWFEYIQQKDTFDQKSITDVSDWLDMPAGKHGWLKMNGEKLIFEDGTPIKFWGTNITERNVYSLTEPHLFARRMAKYGINAIRFHKFTWPESGVVVSEGKTTELDPVKMDGMDKLFFELKKHGIYVTWSHIFGHKISKQDSLKSGFIGMRMFYELENSYGLINFAEDMQDLVIQLTKNLLEHYNPYTGLRYADDPALAIIELQNEDNIFFLVQEKADKFPYYRNLLNKMFSEWLVKKYKTEEELRKAWGEQAFKEGECLDKYNIYAYSNRFLLSPQGIQENKHMLKRLLDSARFLYETQNKYYARYADEIRKTGYKGLIIGSPWMAGEGITHFYNLHSDYLVGPVDRHEYWGGGEGHELSCGKFINRSMLEEPGIGLAKRAFERVVGRPFLMSEWNSTPPNEWITEAPFIIAVYGLGLQGWAGSFSYAIDHYHNIYNVNIPVHLAQYPALARMIYRGDIEEGDYVSVCNIDIEGFSENEFVPENVPNKFFACGKVGINFCNNLSCPIAAFSFIQDSEERKKIAVSTTGQLVWDYEGKGMITVNSPGTQGILGFIDKEIIELDDIIIKDIKNNFVNLTISSADMKPIKQAESLLVTALARCRRIGMTYSEDGSELLDIGEEKLILESVQAAIVLKIHSDVNIYVLDANGYRTGETIPVLKTKEGIEFSLESKYKAFWYEIQIKRN